MANNTHGREQCKAVVYFIRAGASGAIKIGTTRSNPHARLRDLQTGNPDPLTLLAAMPGGADVERGLHERFADSRLTGEWFRPTDRLLGFIEGVASAHALPADIGAGADDPLTESQYDAIDGFVRGAIAGVLCEQLAPFVAMNRQIPGVAASVIEAAGRMVEAVADFQTTAECAAMFTDEPRSRALLAGAAAAERRFSLASEKRLAEKYAAEALDALEAARAAFHPGEAVN